MTTSKKESDLQNVIRRLDAAEADIKQLKAAVQTPKGKAKRKSPPRRKPQPSLTII